MGEQQLDLRCVEQLVDGGQTQALACMVRYAREHLSGLGVAEIVQALAKLLEERGVSAAVINVHTIKPIDAQRVTEYAQKCGRVVTVEEHSVIGGLGDAVAEVLMGKVSCAFKKIGVQDRFGQSGKAKEVLREYGLTAPQIAESIREVL